ncbi:hypothetical protein ACLOJK_015253 [Asimina triloba]
MAGRYDSNPFDDDEGINPFADSSGRGKASAQSNYGGGAFYTTNPGSVPSAANSKLSPLPPEPADFNYDRGSANIDIPLDTAKDLKRKEKELKVKETELNKREQVTAAAVIRYESLQMVVCTSTAKKSDVGLRCKGLLGPRHKALKRKEEAAARAMLSKLD